MILVVPSFECPSSCDTFNIEKWRRHVLTHSIVGSPSRSLLAMLFCVNEYDRGQIADLDLEREWLIHLAMFFRRAAIGGCTCRSWLLEILSRLHDRLFSLCMWFWAWWLTAGTVRAGRVSILKLAKVRQFQNDWDWDCRFWLRQFQVKCSFINSPKHYKDPCQQGNWDVAAASSIARRLTTGGTDTLLHLAKLELDVSSLFLEHCLGLAWNIVQYIVEESGTEAGVTAVKPFAIPPETLQSRTQFWLWFNPHAVQQSSTHQVTSNICLPARWFQTSSRLKRK